MAVILHSKELHNQIMANILKREGFYGSFL